MNDREKKLIGLLLGAAVIMGSFFLFTTYQASMKKNRAAHIRNKESIEMMRKELEEAKSQQEDIEWLNEHPPIESTHGTVGAELATFTEKSALKSGVTIKKRPSPTREDTEEEGAYRSATVKVIGNAMDNQLYRWLADLQSPKDHRSITLLRISPQRDDNTRVDCELEVTQWFTPFIDGQETVSN